MPAVRRLHPALVRALVELSTATNGVDWDTDLSRKGGGVFFPAIRPDASGNLVVVYGESSSTLLPARGRGRAHAGRDVHRPCHDRAEHRPAHRRPLRRLLRRRAGSRESRRDLGGRRDRHRPAHQRRMGTEIGSVVVTPAGGTPPAAVTLPPPAGPREEGHGRAGKTMLLRYLALADGTGVSAARHGHVREAGRLHPDDGRGDADERPVLQRPVASGAHAARELPLLRSLGRRRRNEVEPELRRRDGPASRAARGAAARTPARSARPRGGSRRRPAPRADGLARRSARSAASSYGGSRNRRKRNGAGWSRSLTRTAPASASRGSTPSHDGCSRSKAIRNEGSSEPSISSSTPSSRAFFIDTRTGPSRSPRTRTRDANSSSARSR